MLTRKSIAWKFPNIHSTVVDPKNFDENSVAGERQRTARVEERLETQFKAGVGGRSGQVSERGELGVHGQPAKSIVLSVRRR